MARRRTLNPAPIFLKGSVGWGRGGLETVRTRTLISNPTIIVGQRFAGDGQVEVNGPNESPIFQFLKKNVPGSAISWNFSKFLVNRQGQPVKHYDSNFDEAQLVADLERELGASPAIGQA